MKRAITVTVLFCTILVLLTQIGWLSNGFLGFRLGSAPTGYAYPIFAGILCAIGALFIITWLKK